MDLRGEDEEKWTGFFKELLGKDKFDIPKAIKDKCAWGKAREWIQDKSKYEEPWDTKLGPPGMEEFSDAVKKCKNDKGVNRDEIPAELWKNCPAARQLLWEMVRKVWMQIQVGGEVEIPEDWVDATLVCLYKGKGSRKDPAMHRGISHFDSGEDYFDNNTEQNQKSCGRSINARPEWVQSSQVVQGRSFPTVERWKTATTQMKHSY